MALSISGRPVPSNIPNVGAVKISRLERVDSAGNSVVALAETVVRSMQQISAPFWDYAFAVPPGQVNHEGYGVNLNEINRPYLTPLIDVTSGKALRASFEFPVVARQLTNSELLDGFSSSVDSEILLLQEFANFGIPVQFTNMHPSLTTPAWYIDNLTFNHSRLAISGETAQAICQMSLVEFVPKTTRLILLPRFSYGKFTPIQKKTRNEKTPPTGVDDVERLTLTNTAAKASKSIVVKF
jgi:hypothetical protein